MPDQTHPVCIERWLDRWVPEDARRPFHAVNLGHDRAVDEAGRLENFLVAEVWLLFPKRIADRVVLLGKQGVQYFKTEPPVVRKATQRDASFWISWEQVLVIKVEPAIRLQSAGWVSSQAQCLFDALAIDLGRIPPLRIFVAVGREAGVER